MAALALNIAGRSSELMSTNRSDDWSSDSTKRAPDDHDEVQYFQDGLSTGARILSE